MTSEEISALKRSMDLLLDRINKNGSNKQAQGLENLYGQKYQELFRAGAVPKLRGRYRAQH